MKLIEPLGDVNPVIIAGKSRIPQQLRGKAPLSRIMRREAAEIFGEAFYTDPNEVLTVNLTELVIKEGALMLAVVINVSRNFRAARRKKSLQDSSG